MADYGPYLAVVRDWYDGDTCHMDVDVGFGFILVARNLDGKVIWRCRVTDKNHGFFNTPELRVSGHINPDGEAARAYAEKICPPGTKVIIMSHLWDREGGRFDASITLPDGSDFAQRMIDAGYGIIKT